MKPIFLVAILAIASLSVHNAAAQCTFNPTVTGNLLLCPESNSTLKTQPYDAYQWYGRPFGSNDPAQPISGANAQTLTVNANSTPMYISVAATLNGCTEQSPEVLVDGLAFLPLVVASSGEFDISNNGELLICTGDSVWLVAQLPYTVNFQWYDAQTPLAGQTDDTLLVTSPGSYWLTASPGECPDWTETLGLQIPVIWGSSPGCVTAIKEPGQIPGLEVTPNPASAIFTVKVADFAPVSLELADSRGRVLRQREFAEYTEIDVADLPKGVYVLYLISENGRSVRKLVLD